jgi:two-component system NtrC family sensor kinase
MVPRSVSRVRFWSSLRTEIVLKVIVLTVTVVVLLSIVAIKIVELEVLRQRLRSAKMVVGALHQEVVEHGPRGSAASPRTREEFQRVARRLLRAGNLASLYLVDETGRILVHPNSDLVDQPDVDPLAHRALKEGRVLTSIREDHASFAGLPFVLTMNDSVRIAVPLEGNGGGRVVGMATVPLGDVKRSVARSLRVLLAFITLDAFIVVLFGSWFLSRAVVRPIERLSRAAAAVAAGDLSQRVPVDRGNEIGSLGETFNVMTDRLRESRSRIEDQIVRLENANAELARAQADLIRSEKLASVGRLVAGIAHEVGNPLSSILGLTDILLRGGKSNFSLPPEAREHAQQIRKETGRIHGIVRRLLDFSRPSKAEIREVDLNETVRETLALAAPMADLRQVETRLELDPSVPCIQTDASLLQQVLLNLVINAGQAMPDGGTLRIATRRGRYESDGGRRAGDPPGRDFSHRRLGNAPLRHGIPVVEIEISDSGPGIPEEALPHIFDPFFTTKEPGRGTGLGLAVVHSIVEMLGGNIRVSSDRGKGASFTLVLAGGESDS